MGNNAVDIRQVDLVAATAKPISPTQSCGKVAIVNSTSEELDVYTDPNDATTFCRIAAGGERVIECSPAMISVGLFRADKVAFYLLSAINCTVTLIWT